MMTRLGIALFALVACGQTQSNPDEAAPDASTSTPPGNDDAGAPGDPDAPLEESDPTAGVEWYLWPEQQTIGYASWGEDLVDIARHLPEDYGWQYWDHNDVTAAHETSHGIHAHLRNYEAASSIGWNSFYVLDNQAAMVKEPAMRKSDIKAYVPQVLRGPRYELYLERQVEWDDTPLYIFDEWNAYINGAEVAIDQVQNDLWDGEWQDAVMGPLEFTVYAIATAKAVSVKDPQYFVSNRQFRRFTAWNIKRAMALFETGRLMDEFAYPRQDTFVANLRTHASAEPLRQFARATWGATWTQEVLGF